MSSDSPAALLIDQTGNVVGVVLDGATYRLQVEAALEAGSTVDINDPGTIALETTQEAIRVLVESMDGTLSNVETGIAATNVLLADVATETTLSSIGAVLLSGNQLTGVLGRDGVTIASEANPLPTGSVQVADTGNTVAITDADGYGPGNPWVGAWFATRDIGIHENLTVLASTVTSGLGGTFTFQFSEDAIMPTVDEDVTIDDFETVITPGWLSNAGAYYRVAFEPSRLLAAGEFVFVTTTHSKETGNSFKRFLLQELDAVNVAGEPVLAAMLGVASDGAMRPVRVSDSDSLFVRSERQVITQTGSSFVEGITSHISHIFSRDKGAEEVGKLVRLSAAGTLTHDATEGRAVFATSATNDEVCCYRSEKTLRYDEAAHMLRWELTCQIPQWPLVGTEEIMIGAGEMAVDESIENGIMWGFDASGPFVTRVKNGVTESKVYSDSFNLNPLISGDPLNLFRVGGAPAELDPSKNGYYLAVFEWLGAAPPTYGLQRPSGYPLDVHVEETPNVIEGTTIPEPNIPMLVRIQNDTAAGRMLEVHVGSMRGGTHESRSIVAGRQPDGDVADQRADGQVFEIDIIGGLAAASAPVSFTVDTATDEIIAVGHGLAVDDPLTFDTTDTLPTGITDQGSIWFVTEVTSADRFRVADMPQQSYADIQDAGTGTHTYEVRDYFSSDSVAELAATDGFMDSDQWRSIEIVIETDAPGTVALEYTEDTQASPVVAHRPLMLREVSATVALNGGGVFRFAPHLDGFRLRYINGSAASNILHIFVTLRVTNVEADQAPLGAEVNDATVAGITKAVLAGKISGAELYEAVGTDGSGRLLTSAGSGFSRLLQRQVEDGEELRTDVEPTSTEYYIGKAANGASTAAAVWSVIRIDLSGTRNPTRFRYREGVAWDSRSLGW